MAELEVQKEKALMRKALVDKNTPAKIKPKPLPKDKAKTKTYEAALPVIVGGAVIYFLLKALKQRIKNVEDSEGYYFIESEEIAENVKGNEGEHLVKLELNKLEPSEYKILNNIYLPTEGDISQTEIDHVVVSNYGVFCIETKAIGGAIYGNASDKKWVSYIHGKAFFFSNPCRQNYKHTQVLKKYINKKCVFSIIVFTHAPEVRVAKTSEVVVGTENLIARIMSFKKQVLIDTEKEEIYNLLLAQNIDSQQTRKLHIQQINNMLGKNNMEEISPIKNIQVLKMSSRRRRKFRYKIKKFF